jgi:hypothetical protein
VVLFWNRWDTLGGPFLNGDVEVVRRGRAYFVINTNNALTPSETVSGPFRTFDEALEADEGDPLFVGPGTYEVGRSRLSANALLKRLKIMPLEEDDDTQWEIEVNGLRVRACRCGLTVSPRRKGRRTS